VLSPKSYVPFLYSYYVAFSLIWHFTMTKEIPAAFRVPAGAVIPFGSMEDSLKKSGSLKSYTNLIEKIEAAQRED
jgi:hypothetical protein